MSATSSPAPGSATNTAAPSPGVTTRTTAPSWTLRPGTEADHGFVLHSWLRSFYWDSLYAFKNEQKECRSCHAHYTAPQRIPEATFYALHQLIAKRALLAGRLVCAVDPEAPDVIYGWLLHGGPVLHYAYTKAAWRHQGILRALMRELPRDFVFTHRTPDAERVLRHHPHATYNPYLAG